MNAHISGQFVYNFWKKLQLAREEKRHSSFATTGKKNFESIGQSNIPIMKNFWRYFYIFVYICIYWSKFRRSFQVNQIATKIGIATKLMKNLLQHSTQRIWIGNILYACRDSVTIFFETTSNTSHWAIVYEIRKILENKWKLSLSNDHGSKFFLKIRTSTQSQKHDSVDCWFSFTRQY